MKPKLPLSRIVFSDNCHLADERGFILIACRDLTIDSTNETEEMIVYIDNDLAEKSDPRHGLALKFVKDQEELRSALRQNKEQLICKYY